MLTDALIAESLKRGKDGLEPVMPEPEAVERRRSAPDVKLKAAPKPKGGTVPKPKSARAPKPDARKLNEEN